MNRYLYTQNNSLKFVDPTGKTIELTGSNVQDFIDYLEKKTGLKLEYKTKNGVTTINGGKKDKNFKGTANNELSKIVKKVAGADVAAKFTVGSNMSTPEGMVFMDDNGTAWENQAQNNGVIRPGNVDIVDIQSYESQAPELGMALVGHFLIEGLEMRKPGGNYHNTGTPGAHDMGLEAERKILSEALGAEQATRYQSAPVLMTDTPFSFVYTTVQYDMTIKSSGSITVNKVSPPNIPRPKK